MVIFLRLVNGLSIFLNSYFILLYVKSLTSSSLKGVLIYLNKVMVFIVKRLTADSLMGVVNSTQRRLW
jgi:hypothetical protein